LVLLLLWLLHGSTNRYCGAEAERTMATIYETNETLVKLAWSVRDTGARDRIDRGNTRNREIARRKRMDAKRK
jgi:hypothetical protein